MDKITPNFRLFDLFYIPIKIYYSLIISTSFILFAPKNYTSFILSNPNIPGYLNPIIGILFIFSVSYLVVYKTSNYWKKIKNKCRSRKKREFEC